MSKLTIKTNNVPRYLIQGYQLTEKQKEDFDYIDKDQIDSHEFFIYKGNVYDTGEFLRVPDNEEFKGWQGYSSDSYFSGIVIKFIDYGEKIIVGTYFSDVIF